MLNWIRATRAAARCAAAFAAVVSCATSAQGWTPARNVEIIVASGPGGSSDRTARVVQKLLQPMFAIAKQAGFTQQSFDECLANQKMLNGIEESRTRAASKFNVSSTPTFFINGKIFRGALTVEELDKQVAPYLKG